MMILDFLFGKKPTVVQENSIVIEDVDELVDDTTQTISIIDRDVELLNSMEITAIYSSDDVKKINNNL